MKTPRLSFIAANHPIQRVNSGIRARLIAAQDNTFDRAFSSAADFYARVCDDEQVNVPVPDHLQDKPPYSLSDLPLAELTRVFAVIVSATNCPDGLPDNLAARLAARAHLVRAFDAPDTILTGIKYKVRDIIETFPREAEDIETGRNPGDVLDPYIIAATQTLLYSGDFQPTIGATVAHKALMIIEGLMGHLHEDVIGYMRGNVRAPEPRGYNQELIDPYDNPFPGADVVQPPTASGQCIRFHQIKSKTGSAKGGDGKRLGEQLRRLRQYYGAEVYYDALIGNTLRGHRSMRGVLSAEPDAVVLVGRAVFAELTHSSLGPELLLQIYRRAFADAVKDSGYRIDTMVDNIVSAFEGRATAVGGDFLEALLAASISRNLDQQDSRTYVLPSRRLASSIAPGRGRGG